MITTTHHSPSSNRLVVAAIAATIAAMPVYFIVLQQFAGVETRAFVPGILVIALLVTLVAVLVVGIPVYRSLERRNEDSFLACGLLGGLCGFIASGILLSVMPIALVIGASTGVVVGLTFRLVARGI
jgi:hypothetical protein